MSIHCTPEKAPAEKPPALVLNPVLFSHAMRMVADAVHRIDFAPCSREQLASYADYYRGQLLRIEAFTQAAKMSLGGLAEEVATGEDGGFVWCSVCEKFLTTDSEMAGHCLICMNDTRAT